MSFVPTELRSPDLKHILDLLRKEELEALSQDLGVLSATTKRTKVAFVRALQRYGGESAQAATVLRAR